MDTQPDLSRQDLIAHIAGTVAEAVSGRPGETRQRQNERTAAARGAVMSFQPHDAIQAMIAGQCVMLHEVIVDSAHHLLRGEDAATRRASRTSIVAMDKAFGNNLNRLDHCQIDKTDAVQDARSTDDRTETGISDRINRHRPNTEFADQPASMQAVASTPAMIAAELETDDAESIQYTAQGEPPDAAQTSVLNRQARRALDRRTRKLSLALSRRAATANRNEPTTTACAISAG